MARLIAPRTTLGRNSPVSGRSSLAQDLLHQRLLVVRVVDDEAAADADGLAVLAQDPGAQGVERAGLDVAAALADEADDPLAELGGRLVRERDREDPPRRDALTPTR